MKTIKVHIELHHKDAILPKYAKHGDAGMDVCSVEDVIIQPGETKIIPIGLKFAIPEGYEIQVRPRSGVSFKTSIRIANSPGTIDSGFRDSVGIILHNSNQPQIFAMGYIKTSKKLIRLDNTLCEYDGVLPPSIAISTHNSKCPEGSLPFGSYLIKKGDRVAQIVLKEVPQISWDIIDDVSTIGINRCGGYGSTGI